MAKTPLSSPVSGTDGNLDARVADYVASYEFDADDCHHVPDENERALITDALHGFIGQHCGPIPMIAEAGERERVMAALLPLKPERAIRAGDALDVYEVGGAYLGKLADAAIAALSTPATLDNTAVEAAFKAGWDKCWCRDPDAPTARDGGKQAAWEAYATLTAKTEKAK